MAPGCPARAVPSRLAAMARILRAPCDSGLGSRLDHADDVALGVVEQPDLDVLHDLLRAHQPLGAEALRPGQGALHGRDFHVDGDMARVALRSLPSAPRQPGVPGAGRLALAD